MSHYFDDKPQFNMAVLFLERVNKRLDELDIALANGDLITAYRTLQGLKTNIYFKIKEKGHEEIEKQIINYFGKIKGALTSLNLKQAQQVGYSNAEMYIREVHQIIITIMYEYGFIFPQKKFQNFIEEAEADFE